MGAGLREDLERFEHSDMARLLDKLRESGVPEETLSQAAAQVSVRSPASADFSLGQ